MDTRPMAAAGLRRVGALRWWAAMALGIATMAAVAAEPIVVVQVLAAGEEAGVGVQVSYGVQVGVEQVNAQGGVFGRPLKLVTVSHDGDLQRTVGALRKAVQEQRAVAILGCVGDATCRMAAGVAAELRVPLVGPLAGSRVFARMPASPVFRLRPGYEREAEVLARQLKSTLVQKVALVSDAPQGERALVLQEVLHKEGLDLQVLAVPAGGRGEGEALLKPLGGGGFQAAVLDVGVDTLNLWLDKGLDGRPEWPLMLFGLSGGSAQALMGNFGQRMVGWTAVVPDPQRTAVPAVADLQRLAERHNLFEAATSAGLEGYLNLRLLAEGLRRAARPEPAALRTALEGLRDVDLGGFFVSFAPGRPSASAFAEMRLRPRSSAAQR